MTTSYPYQLKNARGAYNAEINGYEFVVHDTITGVVGTGSDADIKQLLNALTDSSIPNAGSDLSAVDASLTGCWLRKIEAGTLADGKMDITLTYQQSQWGITQIDVGSQLSQIETTNDKDGTAIELTYTYPSDYGGTEPSAEQIRLVNTGEVKQGGTVTILRPEGFRVYTVRETVDPAIPQYFYEGKVNDAQWWFRDAGEWMCTSISGTSDNAGVAVTVPTTFVNRYEFQYRSGGWDPEAVYSDDITGEPVPDPVATEGIKTVPEYNSFDFTELFETPIGVPT